MGTALLPPAAGGVRVQLARGEAWGGGREGAERLQQQATDTEKEYEDVTDKVRRDGVVLHK